MKGPNHKSQNLIKGIECIIIRKGSFFDHIVAESVVLKVQCRSNHLPWQVTVRSMTCFSIVGIKALAICIISTFSIPSKKGKENEGTDLNRDGCEFLILFYNIIDE